MSLSTVYSRSEEIYYFICTINLISEFRFATYKESRSIYSNCRIN